MEQIHPLSSIRSDEVLTGNNIADRCDYVFVRIVNIEGKPTENFANYPPSLTGGELVYTKADYTFQCANTLRQYTHKDIPFSVIIHDSDHSLTDRVASFFEGLSATIYGVNCETTLGNPIPLGVANSYCQITLKYIDFAQNRSPSRLLYVNHRVETCPNERAWLYNHFSKMSWCDVQQPYPKGELKQYKSELLDHKFVLCPRGNGVDTHRMWEALYCGVIPIVKRHLTHSLLEGNLPILFIDDYHDVTVDLLERTSKEFSQTKWNYDMMRTSWWINKMRQRL